MIVGCYSLDLYCRFHPASDGPDKGKAHNVGGGYGVFTGNTYTDCKRDARARGWRFSVDDAGNEDVTCPACERIARTARLHVAKLSRRTR